MTDISKLYKQVFIAEENGNQEKADEIRENIKKVLSGEDIEEVENKDEDANIDIVERKKEVKMKFFYKTRKKTFHKNLREKIEEDNPDDIDLALALTSMLTHSLIEMKKAGDEVYTLLDINVLTETVSDFLSGDLSSEEVVNVVNEYYTEYLTSRYKGMSEDE